MISLSAATLLVVQKTQKLVRTIIVHEMRKSAAGWGLHNDNLFPDREPEPTIDLRISGHCPRVPKH